MFTVCPFLCYCLCPEEKWSQLADQASTTASQKPVVVVKEETMEAEPPEECRPLVQVDTNIYEEVDSLDMSKLEGWQNTPTHLGCYGRITYTECVVFIISCW